MSADNFLRGKKSLVKSTQSLSLSLGHTHTHISHFSFLSQSVFAEMLQQVCKSPQHLHQRETTVGVNLQRDEYSF